MSDFAVNAPALALAAGKANGALAKRVCEALFIADIAANHDGDIEALLHSYVLQSAIDVRDILAIIVLCA